MISKISEMVADTAARAAISHRWRFGRRFRRYFDQNRQNGEDFVTGGCVRNWLALVSIAAVSAACAGSSETSTPESALAAEATATAAAAPAPPPPVVREVTIPAGTTLRLDLATGDR